MGCQHSALRRERQRRRYETLQRHEQAESDGGKPTRHPDCEPDLNFEDEPAQYDTFATELEHRVDSALDMFKHDMLQSMRKIVFVAIDDDACYDGPRVVTFDFILDLQRMFETSSHSDIACEMATELMKVGSNLGFHGRVYEAETTTFMEKSPFDESFFGLQPQQHHRGPTTFIVRSDEYLKLERDVDRNLLECGRWTRRYHVVLATDSSTFDIVEARDCDHRDHPDDHRDHCDVYYLNKKKCIAETSDVPTRSKLVHSIICAVCLNEGNDKDGVARFHGSACRHVSVCHRCAKKIVTDDESNVFKCPVCRVKSRSVITI